MIHPIHRLKICTALNSAGAIEGEFNKEMKFARLREITELSDSALSKQLSTLEAKGYISRFREFGPTRAKDVVWVTLTKLGQAQLKGHLASLRELAGEPGGS